MVPMRILERPADYVYIYYRGLWNLGEELDAAIHGAHENTATVRDGVVAQVLHHLEQPHHSGIF